MSYTTTTTTTGGTPASGTVSTPYVRKLSVFSHYYRLTLCFIYSMNAQTFLPMIARDISTNRMPIARFKPPRAPSEQAGATRSLTGTSRTTRCSLKRRGESSPSNQGPSNPGLKGHAQVRYAPFITKATEASMTWFIMTRQRRSH